MQKTKLVVLAVSAVLIAEMGLLIFLLAGTQCQVSGLRRQMSDLESGAIVSVPDQINQNLKQMIRAARADSGND